MQKYQRQILLPGFGEEKQQLLFDAKVLVVGAGGLGCPALQYLAAAGVGKIGIVDSDKVDISNLHRQILFNENDIGKAKVLVAAEKIKALNPEITVEVFDVKIETQNALEIISGYDVVIDGSDNFPTRYLVNDACVLLNKPLVYGSVYRFEGQVAVFNYSQHNSESENNFKTNYRDLFPQPPGADEIPNCREAGVIGVLPGIIGTMQANEAIKIITGLGNTLANRLLIFNSLDNSFYEIEITPNEKAFLHAPKNEKEFKAMNYEWLSCTGHTEIKEISPEEFERIICEEDMLLIDVRNENELPKMSEYKALSMPLHELKNRLNEIDRNKNIIVFCQTGVRSLKAAQLIQSSFHHTQVFNLKGGITEWKKYSEVKSVNR